VTRADRKLLRALDGIRDAYYGEAGPAEAHRKARELSRALARRNARAYRAHLRATDATRVPLGASVH
jgi:hypothetical protein